MNTQAILNILDDIAKESMESFGKSIEPDMYPTWIKTAKERISSLPSIDSQWIDVNEVYKKLDELQEKESRNFEPMATLVSLGIKQAKSAIYEIATKKFPNN